MTTGRLESFASVDVFISDYGMSAADQVALEAHLDGELVAIGSVALGSQQIRHEQLTISGIVFDTLRVTASGPIPERAYFPGAIDNVVITPEPASLALFMCIVTLILRWRRVWHSATT